MEDSADRLRHLMLTRLRGRHFALINSIVELGSIHRAAAVHGLSQPGASKLVREIEDAVGVPLFERSPTGTRPTAYGLRAAKTCRAINTEIGYLADDLERIREGIGGVIRVGVINYISRAAVAEAIGDLWQEGHRLVVRAENGASGQLLAALVALELDLIIARRSAETIDRDIRFQPIYWQDACILFRRGVLGPPYSLDLEQLAKLRWVLPTYGSPGRVEFDRMMAAAGLLTPEIVAETGDVGLAFNLVRRQPEVVAMLPLDIGLEFAARSDVDAVPFKGDFRYPEVGVMELRRTVRDPAVDLFLDAFRAAIIRRRKLLAKRVTT